MAGSGIPAGLSLNQVVTYVWLAQCLFVIQPLALDSEIQAKIENGNVSLDLARPMDLYAHWFAKIAPGRLAPLCWRGLAVLAAGLQYKGWFLMTIQVLFTVITDPLGLILLFSRFGPVGSWSSAKVFLVYALALTSFGLAEGFARGLDYLPWRMIRSGDFDRLLLRPCSLLLQAAGPFFLHRRLHPHFRNSLLYHPQPGLDLYLYQCQLPGGQMPGGLPAPGTAPHVHLFHADAGDQLLPRRGCVWMGSAVLERAAGFPGRHRVRFVCFTDLAYRCPPLPKHRQLKRSLNLLSGFFQGYHNVKFADPGLKRHDQHFAGDHLQVRILPKDNLGRADVAAVIG